jgi:hypothetical protein
MSENREVPETFTIRLTKNGRDDLSLIANKLGVSVGEALSRAVGMEAFLIEEEEAGTEIILKDKKGNRRFLPVRQRGDDVGRGRPSRLNPPTYSTDAETAKQPHARK